MMYFIESDSTDAAHNLALEQHVFDTFDRRHDYFLLWQSDNTIVVGKHQNALAEINSAYVKRRGIAVVRRLSGGGAVYHDLGNFNFSFIMNGRDLASMDLNAFCRPLLDTLAQLGVHAELNHRHDMLLGGRKISGTAQYCRQGRILHHGTLLYDSDLNTLEKALMPSGSAGMESKAVKSVRSPVANIRENLRRDMTRGDFLDALRALLVRNFALTAYEVPASDHAAIEQLRSKQYATWDWTYGASPDFTFRRERSATPWGTFSLRADVKKGYISSVHLSASGLTLPPETYSRVLVGCRFAEDAIRQALATLPLPEKAPEAARLAAELFM